MLPGHRVTAAHVAALVPRLGHHPLIKPGAVRVVDVQVTTDQYPVNPQLIRAVLRRDSCTGAHPSFELVPHPGRHVAVSYVGEEE